MLNENIKRERVLKWCADSGVTPLEELLAFEKYVAVLEAYPQGEHMTIQRVPPSVTEHLMVLRSIVKKK